MIIDFDRLFKLSSISIDFYQFLSILLSKEYIVPPHVHQLGLRAAKLQKRSLKIVVVKDKLKRQISKLAEGRYGDLTQTFWELALMA